MKLRYLAFVAFGLTLASPVSAQTSFDGTWKVDVATAQLPTKPFGWTLMGTSYSCSSCTPPYTVPADGAFHAVTGQPYWDETAVKVIDGKTVVQTWKQNGKVTDTISRTLSADSKTLRWDEVDTSSPAGQTLTNSGTYLRVTDGPSGAHALSGTWRTGKVDKVADESLTMSFMTSGDQVTMTSPAGYHYTAKIGGPAVPVVGDQANTLAALTMTGSSVLTETDSRAGKTVSAMTMTVGPDAKTMAITYYDALRDTTAKYIAKKQ